MNNSETTKEVTPFIYMVGYDRTFQKNCNTGWGCGYVCLPIEHPKAVLHFERLADDNKKLAEAKEDEYIYVNPYFEIAGGLNQEVTLTETEEIDGDKYLVIGFDTAHSWNDSTHNFNYVFRETREMLNIILAKE